MIASLLQKVTARIAARAPLVLSSLRGGAKAWLLAALSRQVEHPLVVLCSSFQRAERLYEDLVFFAGAEHVFHFPHWDTIPYDSFSPHKEVMGQRFRALAAVLEGRCPILITTSQAMMQGMLPLEVFRETRFFLKAGQCYPREELLAVLTRAGYVRVDMVEGPGEFSVRGEIIDLFSIQEPHPLRLDFFEDQLESLRYFDVATQQSFQEIDALSCFPAGECIINPQSTARALACLPHYKSQLQPEVYRQLGTCLENGTPFPGAEQLLGLFYPQPGWLHQALAPSSLLFFDEPQALAQQEQDFFAEVLAEFEMCIEQGNLALPPAQMYLSPQALRQALAPFYRPELIELPLEGGEDILTCPFFDNQTLRSTAAAGGASGHATLTRLMTRLKDWRNEGAPVLLAARSNTGAERLYQLLSSMEIGGRIETAYDTERKAASPTQRSPSYHELLGQALSTAPAGEIPEDIRILASSPSQGFRFGDAEGRTRFALITEEELLGEKAPQRHLSKSNLQRFIASLGDLKEGDFVVHLEYGIGCYEGLRTLRAGPAEGDFLVLRYAAGDKVYVPVYHLNQVQKFTGVEGAAPALNKLGDGNWQKTRHKVSHAIQDMAEELIHIQAARRLRKGFGFERNEALLAEFEQGFPYQETADQQRAIGEVLEDMAAEQPMDRLVCGDVGFGKTEVALRAAYLAVLSAKQVLVLVPTTILAQQHHETFSVRFAEFGVRVDMLSRFRLPQEQKEVLKAFAEGKIDILIGTHRLLSRDVQPKALGLLVIDEEQRFGVRHKEKIKQLRTQVDVVTLSATPIPRTLHMALMGVRDLSIIETPPMDRLAIRTRLARASDYIIREAVQRELRRGGQVFFVNNKVENIHTYGIYLQGLLPQLQMGIAHGQMNEKELERVMLRFVRGELQLLLSTTIIESGLDIPRANTIIIHNADHFGLAQLYQLRGRVGRSHLQGYAYLLVSPEKVLSEVAQRRLSLLQEFNDLGSGFKIAAHDLEIRGAGDLLGRSQSGHVNAIGLEAYTQMVQDALARLQDQETQLRKTQQCTIELGYAYLLPEGFIQSTSQRLEAYKRLAEIRDEEEMWAYRQLLEDRYGALPSEAQMLFALIQLRLQALRYGLSALEKVDNQLQVRIGEPERIDMDKLMALLQDPTRQVQLLPEDRILLGALPPHPEQILERLKVLEEVIRPAAPPPALQAKTA